MKKKYLKTILQSSVFLGMLAFNLSSYSNDLATLYPLAVANDHIALNEIANYQADKNNVAISRANLLPQLSANAESIHYISGENNNTKDTQNILGLNISETLLDLNNLLNLNSSHLMAQADDYGIAATQQDLIQRFTTTYFATALAQNLLVLASQEQQDDQSLLDLANTLYKAGSNTAIDVADAKTAYLSAQVSKQQALLSLTTNQSTFKLMLSDEPGVLLEAPEDIPLSQPAPNNIDQWKKQADQTNPALLQDTFKMLAAKKNIQAANANHLPSLSLDGSWNNSSANATNANGNKRDQTTASLSLNIPIFSGGSITAQSRQQQSLYQAAVEQRLSTQQSVYNDISLAFTSISNDIIQLKLLRQSIASAKDTLKKTQIAYKGGLKTMSDVISAQNMVYTQKRKEATARYDYLTNIFTLKQASGQLSESDLYKVNDWLH